MSSKNIWYQIIPNNSYFLFLSSLFIYAWFNTRSEKERLQSSGHYLHWLLPKYPSIQSLLVQNINNCSLQYSLDPSRAHGNLMKFFKDITILHNNVGKNNLYKINLILLNITFIVILHFFYFRILSCQIH